ncbi:D-alanyl-D-alanine carboxypeptidase [Candidatus Uhrbacteria bacterium]|nr:D-alanyl-D-alanine carboxypeptidase [Candidatus Uhrbacteria bacterium]
MLGTKAFLGVIFFVGGLFFAVSSNAAVLKTDAVPFVPLENEFASAIVLVPHTHQQLYAFKPDHARVAASLTKLANALAFVKSNPKWQKVVSIKKVDEVGGGRLRVTSGTLLTIKDLMFSSITASANNAATALGRISGFGSKGFIHQMNAQVKLAGAKQSVFFDASGMDPRSKTTARDMALIAEKAFKQPMIRQAAQLGTYDFPLVGTREHKVIKNTNYLLTQDDDVWVVGGKTGYLEESKYNFVVQLRPMSADGRSPDPSKELIITVLGAPTKEGSFNAAKRLAEWAWFYHEF